MLSSSYLTVALCPISLPLLSNSCLKVITVMLSHVCQSVQQLSKVMLCPMSVQILSNSSLKLLFHICVILYNSCLRSCYITYLWHSVQQLFYAELTVYFKCMCAEACKAFVMQSIYCFGNCSIIVFSGRA